MHLRIVPLCWSETVIMLLLIPSNTAKIVDHVVILASRGHFDIRTAENGSETRPFRRWVPHYSGQILSNFLILSEGI